MGSCNHMCPGLASHANISLHQCELYWVAEDKDRDILNNKVLNENVY